MLTHVEKPKAVPNFNAEKIAARASEIHKILFPYKEQKLSADQVNKLCDDLVKVLPYSIDNTVLFAALSKFTLIAIAKDDIKFLSWRLAGDIDNLRFTSRGLSLDRTTAGPGWCLVKCVEAQEAVIRGEFKYILKFFCLAGPWAGVEVELPVSTNMAKIVASRIGFNRRKKETRMRHPSEFVGLRLSLFIAPDTTREGSPPVITEYAVKAKYLKTNKEIIRGRNSPCLTKQANSCWVCMKGQDECRYAVREQAWVAGVCPGCFEQKMLDPRHTTCYTCRHNGLKNQLRQLYAQEEH